MGLPADGLRFQLQARLYCALGSRMPSAVAGRRPAAVSAPPGPPMFAAFHTAPMETDDTSVFSPELNLTLSKKRKRMETLNATREAMDEDEDEDEDAEQAADEDAEADKPALKRQRVAYSVAQGVPKPRLPVQPGLVWRWGEGAAWAELGLIVSALPRL